MECLLETGGTHAEVVSADRSQLEIKLLLC